MANIQTINIGSSPNDGEGDALRLAFEKTNINFSLLNSELANLSVNVSGAENVGASGAGIFKGRSSQDSTVLEFKKLISGSGITITDIGDEISISSSLAIDIGGQAPGSVLTISSDGGLNVTGLLKVDQARDSVVIETNLDMNLSSILNVANPTRPQDAATKFYVDAQLSSASTGISVLENNNIITSARQLNFVGDGVNIIQSAVGKVDISITSGVDTVAVQEIVGQMFTDNLNEGIVTNYSSAVQKINLSVNDFDIILDGDITGRTTVSNFGNDIIITTAADFLRGLTVTKDSVDLGSQNTVRTLNFVGSNIELSRDEDIINISVDQGLSESDVRNEIGSTIKGVISDPLNPSIETESGITTRYVPGNNTLEIGVRDFVISLSGAVQGSATVSRLQNVNIITTSDAINGLTISKDSVQLGAGNSVKSMNFVGDNISVERSSDTITIAVGQGLTESDVRNEIGTTVKGVVSDPLNPSIETESGITTRYVPGNNTLELGVREFDITLSGAVTGTGRVSRLRDVNIITTSDAINGLTISKNSTNIGIPNSIKTLNFVGENISISRNGDIANVVVTTTITGDQVTDLLNPRLLGQQDGLSITYDSLNRIYNYRINPITIRLAGAVSGSGVITFDGTSIDGNVVINTTGGTDGAGGISVADEGAVQGQASVINFVGGGITTAVSLDGTTATVYVPNSPAAEPFITATAGSENIPNARRLVGGTGVSIVDGGPGGNIVISANSDAILAKSSYSLDGEVVAEQFGINIKSTQWIIPIMENDSGNNRVNLSIYDLRDAWYRLDNYDAGTLIDNEGPILDFGPVIGGILEAKPDLGLIS